MKAAILKEAGKFALEEIPKPQARPGTAVVRVTYCAICGSDRRRFEKGGVLGLMGHEFAGEIAEVGEGLEGWKAGDRVTVDPITYCHKCYFCRHGQENLCPNQKVAGMKVPGAYAEYYEALPEQLFRTPPNLDDPTATMAQCLAVALHGVKKAPIKIPDKVIVIGAGPIGLLALQLAKKAGASALIAYAKGEGRKAMAAKLGANYVIDAKDIGERTRINEITGLGGDVVLECSGGADALPNAITLARRGGTVIIIGGYKGISEIRNTDIYEREIKIDSSLAYTHEEFGQAIDLIANKEIDAKALVSTVESLENIQHAFDGLRQLGDQVKVLISPCK